MTSLQLQTPFRPLCLRAHTAPRPEGPSISQDQPRAYPARTMTALRIPKGQSANAQRPKRKQSASLQDRTPRAGLVNACRACCAPVQSPRCAACATMYPSHKDLGKPLQSENISIIRGSFSGAKTQRQVNSPDSHPRRPSRGRGVTGCAGVLPGARQPMPFTRVEGARSAFDHSVGHRQESPGARRQPHHTLRASGPQCRWTPFAPFVLCIAIMR